MATWQVQVHAVEHVLLASGPELESESEFLFVACGLCLTLPHADLALGRSKAFVNSQQSFQTHAIVNSQQSPGISSSSTHATSVNTVSNAIFGFSTHATCVNTVSNLPRHQPSPVPRANANVRESVVINH
ncbi:hypothetical protein ZHAS_00012797 [Anopheles sinensis]|uniref:Uncharacterized protein n=1 Tax=Anopheles sinensis TaxID=74873 RepID=A0A084W3U3_ANOSI|nr:hypothetical protein ZHAS_00012797 [Anopheles sinensis]